MRDSQELIQSWQARLFRLAWLSADCGEHEYAYREMQQIEATILQFQRVLEALCRLEETFSQRGIGQSVVREFALLSPAPPFFKEVQAACGGDGCCCPSSVAASFEEVAGDA